MKPKLNAFGANLIAAKRALILQAAEISAMPPDNTLRKIASQKWR